MFQGSQAEQRGEQLLRTGSIEGDDSLPVGQTPKRRGRLLIVEDSRCGRGIIRSRLQHLNLVVEMAENGRVACEMAEKSKSEENPYDLILMDIQMPQMNGYEATQWLREHGWTGPIVAVTAYTTPEDCQKCLDAGCNEHLSKPIAETALNDIITRHMTGITSD